MSFWAYASVFVFGAAAGAAPNWDMLVLGIAGALVGALAKATMPVVRAVVLALVLLIAAGLAAGVI